MDFSRLVWMVANRVMTKAPLSLTNFYVVSRDSICMDFLVAELNDLDIMACDVGNEYFNAPFLERIWFAAGPEHGSEKTVKIMGMVRDLYGLRLLDQLGECFLQIHCAICILCKRWMIQTYIVYGQGSLMVNTTMNYYYYM